MIINNSCPIICSSLQRVANLPRQEHQPKFGKAREVDQGCKAFLQDTAVPDMLGSVHKGLGRKCRKGTAKLLGLPVLADLRMQNFSNNTGLGS